MIMEYLDAAMGLAKYETIDGENSIYGEIPGFSGLYACEHTIDDCRAELRDALEDWLLISLRKGLPIPVINNLNLEVREAA